MIFSRSVFFTLSVAALVSILTIQQTTAQQQAASKKPKETRVGGLTVATILEKLGAKLEHGISAVQMSRYDRQFSVIDTNDDGRHSKVEYIENGTYMTPQARRGIFNAADSDQDGFVTKAEYTLNRIITDEGKALIQAMDDDKDGVVQRAEFIGHATAKLSDDAQLADQVFAALDTNANNALMVPEYLRVWGQWARAGGKKAEQRLEAAKKEAKNEPTNGS